MTGDRPRDDEFERAAAELAAFADAEQAELDALAAALTRLRETDPAPDVDRLWSAIARRLPEPPG